jgi:hypothetical protein
MNCSDENSSADKLNKINVCVPTDKSQPNAERNERR